MKKIRVLVADDSAFMRREIKRILETDPDIEVVALARDGEDAVIKTREYDPDVVALDINMPVMDGLTALQYIMMESPRPVVMISSLTQEGALITYEALELGAVDFVGKPGGTISLDIRKVAKEIIFKIKAAALSKRDRLKWRGKERKSKLKVKKPDKKVVDEKIVVIGQSTGGPNTIMDIVPYFPENFGAAVLIIQHMPSSFTPSFAKRLDANCNLYFKEAERGDIVIKGNGYLAPGDMQMVLVPRGFGEKGAIIRLSEEPDTLHKPSVNVTMKSVLRVYDPKNIIAVLLTGMGDDGAEAMGEIRKAGGRTIAESEETCIVFGMPKEAIERGGAEFVLPSYEIGKKIVELVYE